MKDMKVCRICLNMDVKMFDLHSYPLQSYYESVIGSSNSLYNVSLPPYACYECAALVRKYYFFKQKCQRSQAVLFGIADGFGKVTAEDIKAVDRESLHLASRLVIVIIPEDKECYQPATCIEPSNCSSSEHNIREDGDFYSLPDQDLSSDQTLSYHEEKKSNRTKFKDNVEEKIDFNKLELEFASDDLSELSVAKDIEKRPKIVKKSSRRRVNSSLLHDDLNDMEQYITVINLSVDEQIEEMNKRKQSSNYLNSPYKCNLCYKGFIDIDTWKRHRVSKHSPSAGHVECPICQFRYKTKSALQKHMSTHEKKYACKSCPYISTTTTQAKQHQGWHKGVTFKCEHCDEIFTIWTSYMGHIRIKHPSEFICGICGYSFVSKLGLAMHKTMMHKDVLGKPDKNKEDGPYCTDCDVKFISKEAHKRHIVMSVKHTKSTDFIKGCRTCGETFKDLEELRLHNRKEHTRKWPKHYGKKPTTITSWPSKCEHCSEEIPNAREYWTHFRRMHPDKHYPIRKDYVCDICGKRFRANAFLVNHKRTHFEEKAYKCSQCDKAFYNRTNLQVHEKTHSDNRPYPCSVCFKAFKCKAALDRHFRTHTGQKPYECEVCGKGFSQSNSRKLHVRTVHLKQPAPYVSRNRRQRRNKITPKEEVYLLICD